MYYIQITTLIEFFGLGYDLVGNLHKKISKVNLIKLFNNVSQVFKSLADFFM